MTEITTDREWDEGEHRRCSKCDQFIPCSSDRDRCRYHTRADMDQPRLPFIDEELAVSASDGT